MKNNFVLGLALGTIFPLLAYLIQHYSSLQASLFAGKPIALYIFAATINLVAVRFLYRAQKEATGNGIILLTFIAMLVLVILQREVFFR